MTNIRNRFSHVRAKLLRRGTTPSSPTVKDVSTLNPENHEQRLQPSPVASPRTVALRRSLSLSKEPRVSTAQLSDRSSTTTVENDNQTTSNDRQSIATATLTPTHGHDPDFPSITHIDSGIAHKQSNSPDIPISPTLLASNTNLPCQSLDTEEVSTAVQPPRPVTAVHVTHPDSTLAAVDTAILAARTSSADTRIAETSHESQEQRAVAMARRKIWVKRANASATMVQINEEDLVDDVRDLIIRKYGNSLGRNFDAPDLSLRILPRDNNSRGQDRALGPEEDICKTIDLYFPGGQTVNEALVIEVPRRHTPKPSPRAAVYYAHHDDTHNHQTGYFPLMPPAISPAAAAHDSRIPLPHAHSIAILETGHLPNLPLPSPGSTRRGHISRPRNARHNTASPTAITAGGSSTNSARPSIRPRHDSSASDTRQSASSNAPLPTPPAPSEPVRQIATPPVPRVASPRPEKKKKKTKHLEPPSLLAGLVDNSVPPISVLIVEDNIINLRVLGAFMQRLKVRWQRAMNGKEALTKWRAGGFHLVLMDIQLPIMNGLEATREIRRLERINSIGVFSSGSSEAPNNRLGADGNHSSEIREDDKLGDKKLFKSPVIIVALTASSLQSDRHEALAAGCNDFLTKPVSFDWLERKVKEWGCMQALIDFDGWRKWKDYATDSDSTANTSNLSTSYATIAPRKSNKSNNVPSTANTSSTASTNGVNGTMANGTGNANSHDANRSRARRSMPVVPPPVLPEEQGPSAGVSSTADAT